MPVNTIVSLTANASHSSLHLAYADGARVEVDFAPIIAVGGVAARLRDAKVLTGATIGSRGRCVDFGDEMEFCADALRLLGIPTRSAA